MPRSSIAKGSDEFRSWPLPASRFPLPVEPGARFPYGGGWVASPATGRAYGPIRPTREWW